MSTPRFYSIVSGIGTSEYELVAFDKALLTAGIGDYNLIKVSSIIPAGCEYNDSITEGKGSILFAAYSFKIVKNGEKGSSGVAVAIPASFEESGVIFETTSDEDDAEDIAKKMCKEAMDAREKAIRIIKSSSAIVEGEPGKYTCGISAVVMWG